MMKNLLFLFLSMVCLVSCTHTTHNLKSVEDGNMAAVISGCRYVYQANSLFKTEVEQKCIAIWSNETGEEFAIKGYQSVAFVKPGTYEFVGYKSTPSLRSSYKKHLDALSIFTKFSVSAGDVVYIGNLNVDSRKSKQVVQSMSFSQNFEESKKYLEITYPNLLNKLKPVPITFSEDAQAVRKFLETRLTKAQ